MLEFLESVAHRDSAMLTAGTNITLRGFVNTNEKNWIGLTPPNDNPIQTNGKFEAPYKHCQCSERKADCYKISTTNYIFKNIPFQFFGDNQSGPTHKQRFIICVACLGG